MQAGEEIARFFHNGLRFAELFDKLEESFDQVAFA